MLLFYRYPAPGEELITSYDLGNSKRHPSVFLALIQFFLRAMKKKTRLTSKILALFVVYMLLSIRPVWASQDIVIQDLEGTIRAQGELTADGDGVVRMEVTDASGAPVADGEVITLTPVAGGTAITGTVIGGEVVFSGLGAGAYTVASTSVVTFSSITVGAVGGAVAAGGVAAVGGTAVAAVAGAGAVGIGAAAAINNNSSTNNGPISPFR